MVERPLFLGLPTIGVNQTAVRWPQATARLALCDSDAIPVIAALAFPARPEAIKRKARINMSLTLS